MTMFVWSTRLSVCRVSENLKVWGLESGDLGDWKSESLGVLWLGNHGDLGVWNLGAGWE